MLELKAKNRNILGSKVKSLRSRGAVPAILYGAKMKSTPIEIDYNDFKKTYEEAGESTILKLKVNNNGKTEEKNVLIYEVERDPVSGKFTHIDFYAVRMDKPITAEVPLVFQGESPVVETEDGVLVKNMTEVEVEALPANLPHQIEIDLSPLKTFDDMIHIKDLRVGEGVKILAEPDEVVVSVVPPRSEEELAALEEEVEEVKEAERAGEEEEKEKEVPAEEKEGEAQGKAESSDLSAEAKQAKTEASGEESK